MKADFNTRQQTLWVWAKSYSMVHTSLTKPRWNGLCGIWEGYNSQLWCRGTLSLVWPDVQMPTDPRDLIKIGPVGEVTVTGYTEVSDG